MLGGCGRVFIDGGSNMGEAVGAFADGRFFSCAMQAPPRNHRAAWASMGRGEKEASMGPLREPRSFCVRSFEAAPSLLPPLREEEASLRARGFDVRFVDGALSNRTVQATLARRRDGEMVTEERRTGTRARLSAGGHTLSSASAKLWVRRWVCAASLHSSSCEKAAEEARLV